MVNGRMTAPSCPAAMDATETGLDVSLDEVALVESPVKKVAPVGATKRPLPRPSLPRPLPSRPRPSLPSRPRPLRPRPSLPSLPRPSERRPVPSSVGAAAGGAAAAGLATGLEGRLSGLNLPAWDGFGGMVDCFGWGSDGTFFYFVGDCGE